MTSTDELQKYVKFFHAVILRFLICIVIFFGLVKLFNSLSNYSIPITDYLETGIPK